MKKILVTGGTGYIGSHTVVELFYAGFEVVIIDDLSNSHPAVIDQLFAITGKKFEFHQIDLCDEKLLRKFARANRDITGIIHFAASKAVGESVADPLKYYRNNVCGLVNLLGSFNWKIDIVFSSSCTVYGQPDVLPVSEQAEVKRAMSPYGNTKQICEEILMETAGASAGLGVISLRYFNPVGAHHSALIGELPTGVPANLVPFITQSAAGIRGPLVVHGNDYDTPDGSAVRDYIHVVDLARAHVAALARLGDRSAERFYEVFNIGTGKGYSVLELISAFQQATGQRLDYTIGPKRPGDIASIYGEVSRANLLLGWKAELGIQQMMESAWKWQRYINDHPFKQI
jgi:UDP-glucose 4-epimerase